jgi:carbonic anhydrase
VRTTIAIVALVVGLSGSASPGGASAPPAAQTQETQAALTPDAALALLKAGNERFAAGRPLERDELQQVRLTSSGQFPYAAILGCIDSRVPPELVFDTGIGDVFAARIAGNVLDDELLGSLEFAAGVAGAKAIVVLGHTECGAVKGACDGVKMGHLTQTLSHLEPAVAAARAQVPPPHDAKNGAFVRAVIDLNAELTAQSMTERSPILRGLVAQGKLRIVPAVYDVSTGHVKFLG